MNKLLTLALALFITQTTQAATNITGQIRTNTTWTKAGSPYILSGDLEIAPDITLTLEPGTVVQIHKDIIVYGFIKAIGSSLDSIRFLRTQNSDKWGNINLINNNALAETVYFKYCVFDHTHLDVKEQHRIEVEYCFFYGASVHARSNSDIILQYNKIYGSSYLIDVDSGIVRGNYLNTGDFSADNCNYVLYDENYITGGEYGIKCESGGVTMTGNTITATTRYGIYLRFAGIGNSSNVVGNILTGNHAVGIYIYYLIGEVKENSIYDNATGIQYAGQASPSLSIMDNCIYDNDYNFYNDTPDPYNIGKNWWGSNDSATIRATVYDYENDFKKGTVSFMPVLNNSGNLCKTAPPPTDVPDVPGITAPVSYGFRVFPVPFKDNIQFIIDDGRVINAVKVFDMLGREMTSMEVDLLRYVEVDAAHYPAGGYIYKVRLDDNSFETGKLIKN